MSSHGVKILSRSLGMVLFRGGNAKSAVVLTVSFVDVVTHQIPKQMVSCHPGVRELAPFGNPW